MDIKIGAGAIIVEDNKILLAKRKNNHGAGTYGSVGGHIEFGEAPTEAVIREAKEELDIIICNLEFICCTNLIKYQKHYIDITFSAKIKSGIPKIIDEDKIETVAWYDLDKIPSPLFKPVELALIALDNKQSFFEVNEE